MGRRQNQPPQNIASNPEVMAWIAKLESENKSVVRRNNLLYSALIAVVLIMLFVLFSWYRSSVYSYAVLQDVKISQDMARQGRLQFQFQVVSPGKVFYRRTAGNTKTEVIDYFVDTGRVQRTWSWIYEPGTDINVALWYRQGLWKRSASGTFPTTKRTDIVVLMDTTGSMSRCIQLLKEKCIGFSSQLKQQALEHRFALIGFGDANEDEWLDKHQFTDNVVQFQKQVTEVKRFDGGDLPESALDAIEAALSMPFANNSMRLFYLVTDAQFHALSKSGATVADIVKRLEHEHVILNVFSRTEFESDYAPLLNNSGKFQKLEDFGKVLTEGRILED